jgi:hypothetical protein
VQILTTREAAVIMIANDSAMVLSRFMAREDGVGFGSGARIELC